MNKANLSPAGAGTDLGNILLKVLSQFIFPGKMFDVFHSIKFLPCCGRFLLRLSLSNNIIGRVHSSGRLSTMGII